MRKGQYSGDVVGMGIEWFDRVGMGIKYFTVSSSRTVHRSGDDPCFMLRYCLTVDNSLFVNLALPDDTVS